MALINKYSKLKKFNKLTDSPTLERKKTDGWDVIQSETGNDWIYETYAPASKYSHAAIIIFDNVVSLLGFNKFTDMCNDAGWDIDSQPDLDNMSDGEQVQGDQGELYIKLF